MSTSDKIMTVTKENGIKITSYTNQSDLGGATGRFGGLDSPGVNPTKNKPKKKKKKAY